MTLAISKFTNIFLFAYQNTRLLCNVSRRAILTVIMKIFFSLEEVAYVDKWNHVNN